MEPEPDQRIVRARRSFKGTAWESIQHPEDRAALDALKRVPMLDQVISFVIKYGWERAFYLQNISSSLKVSGRQAPRVWYLFNETCRILGVENPPDIYITQHPVLNAYTYGTDKIFIMLHSSLVDGANDDELLAAIGHEMGHVLSGHCLYTTMAAILTPLIKMGLRTFPGGMMVASAVEMALFRWLRASELTGDRFGLLTCQDTNTMVQLMMKFAGGATNEQRDVMEFIAQAQSYKDADESVLDNIFKLMQTTYRTHPLTVIRAQEVMTWSQSRIYQNMMAE
jgi:Zn-dependent protease with chaperone function